MTRVLALSSALLSLPLPALPLLARPLRALLLLALRLLTLPLPASPLPSLRRVVTRVLAALVVLLLPATVLAQVTVNEITFASNIGRTLDVPITLRYTRTSSAAASISTLIPNQLTVGPPAAPAGCTINAGSSTTVDCTVPAGNSGESGTLIFSVRGAVLGTFSLAATGTGGSTASNPGTVRSSGDVTVSKTKSPVGNVLAGQSVSFTLSPDIAATGDDLPSGATLTVTDNLPGTATDFVVNAINAGSASCNSVSSANSSRTVTCTYAGPLSAASLNAASITVTGSHGTNGSFSNGVSIAADQFTYVDQNLLNNTAQVSYGVNPASDAAAQGSFPSSSVQVSSAQSLTLRFANSGPMNFSAGGTVATTIAAGFTVSSLPAGCSGPATGVVLGAPAALSCTAGAVANGASQSFVVPLLMPASAGAGNFSVTVAPPAGFGDANSGNDTIALPWQTAAPYADLRLVKGKNPASGPIAPADAVITTLTITNDAGSNSAATYSAAGGANPLRVIDYLQPTEIAGDAIDLVTAGWTCSVANAADPLDATRTKRITCSPDSAGTLAIGASITMGFRTFVAALVGQQVLVNRACTGETALSELGLSAAQGPQPAGNGSTANDCTTQGGTLVATEVVSGQAVVTMLKESSIDGSTWVDNPAAAPTLAAAATNGYWRLSFSTAAGAPQKTIPTLTVTDNLPGLLNVSSPGAPAPAFQTPAITVSTNVTSGSASGSCPNLSAGSAVLTCTFSNVTAGTTIVVVIPFSRPINAGTMTNTATLTSPDAVLTGTLSDSAALIVTPRIDVAATTKTVAPVSPRVGQTAVFTLTAQNLGPDPVTTAGDFKIIDDLNTSVAGAAVAFADITASGTNMSCAVVSTALPDEAALPANTQRVRCTNTNAVNRYAVRTVTINARVLKPATLPVSGNAYTGQTNAQRADLNDTQCEFKTETSTNGSVSAACNDGAATSNNTVSASFDVLVPQIDLQQRKTRVLPGGQSNFGVGQPLRYRFRIQNNGPSRAEGVLMTDALTVPSGFTLSAPVVANINGAAAEGGYTLDASKAASVSCTQAAANADLVCTLAPIAANNWLDAGREVNFEVSFTQSGTSLVPVTFSNQALVCADETLNYENGGGCNRALANNNNVASVNDTIFPRTDLSISKTRVTASPVAINQPVAYDLVVRNLGPDATQRIRVQDVLPANFEFFASGPNAPTLTLGSFVTAAPSTASGATVSCTGSPATLASAGQTQTVSCDVDAVPGPLGAGGFPGSADANNTLTLRLWVRAREGLYSGPVLSNRTNTASVSPGQDGSGNALSIDTVSGNNSATATVQVNTASVAGRIYNDRRGNGVQDGTLAAEDEGIGSVALTLAGTDSFGNAVSRSTSSVNTVGTTRGDFAFVHLPPGTYTITETQPAGFVNGASAPLSFNAGGSYTAAATVSSSTFTGLSLSLGQSASGYDFPESLPAAVISGVVFNDRDRNGAQGGTEPGINGVSVALYATAVSCPASGALPLGALQTVVTAGNGAWSFAPVTSGNSYSVCQGQPADYGDRPPVAGISGSTPRANQIDISALPLGGSTGHLFPEVLGAIAGAVYQDYGSGSALNDDNGVRNVGESGIANVPITVLNTGSGITVTVLTDGSGAYVANDLLPGSYSISEGALPPAAGVLNNGRSSAGTVDGVARGAAGNDVINAVLMPAGGVGAAYNFGELPPASSISGVVYIDRNRDGALTAADPGRVAAVTVRLLEGASCTGTELGRTTTSINGDFGFPGGNVSAAQLSAGRTYSVCEDQPASFADGATTPGNAATSPAPNHIVISNLPPTGSTNNLFGEGAASLAGRVFLDAANDGVFNSADSGIVNVVLTLSGGPLSAPLSTTSAADGTWRFDDLLAGSYTVTEQLTQPVVTLAGSSFSTLNGRTRAGTANAVATGSATGVGSTPSAVGGIAVPLAGAVIDVLFAEILPARLAGRVWLDVNNNGVQDAGEAGIAQVSLSLSGTDSDGNAVSRSTVTAADGRYAFADLRPGTYGVLQAVQPAGTVNSRTLAGSLGGSASNPSASSSQVVGVLLTPGAYATANDFAEVPAARIAGSVFEDRNDDGQRQSDEAGYVNQSIVLSGTDDLGAVTLTAVTDASGAFSFSTLRPGSYTLTQPAQPAGTVAGLTTAGALVLIGGTASGTTIGTASSRATAPSAISGIVLSAGQASLDNLFGEIGDGPDLVVTKTVSPSPLTELNAGAYTLRVRNAGNLASSGTLTVTDTLPAGLSLLPGTAGSAGTTGIPNPAGAGWSCSAAAQVVSCTSTAVVAAGAEHPAPIVLQVQVANDPCNGTWPCSLDNRVWVEGGGERPGRAPTGAEHSAPPACVSGAATQNACRLATPIQQSGGVSGVVWLDVDHDRVLSNGIDIRQSGFVVELVRDGVVSRTTRTDAQGAWRIVGLVPGTGYEVRFRDAASGAYYGRPLSADPAGGNDPSAFGPAGVVPGGAIRNLTIPGGNALRVNQDLPLDPNGVVYDSQSRQPVAGVVVELLGPDGAIVPTACVLGGLNRITTTVGQVGAVDGGYAFMLNTPPPSGCPGDGIYTLRLTPPAGYVNADLPSDGTPRFASSAIPAQAGVASVPASCRDFVAGAPCAIQSQVLPPTGAQPTTYYLRVPITPATPATFADIVNNHIPLDPFGGTRFVVTKQPSAAQVELGDPVTYTVTVRHLAGPPLPNVRVEDRLPAGFRLIPGTWRVAGVLQPDPTGTPGPVLNFGIGTLAVQQQVSFSYIVRVGVGARQGDGINRAQGSASNGVTRVVSNVAQARVKVQGGVFDDAACIVGKVYVDCNHDQVQGAEELGIPGVRIVLLDGTSIVTDSEGKFSICGLPPRTQVLKVDKLSLPRGSRLITSSSRNAGDAGSLFADLKNGELHRSDFIEGSCSNTVLEQVKARRAQGEVRAPELERRGGPALKFQGKAARMPQQGTDSANQVSVKSRPTEPGFDPKRDGPATDELNTPVHQIPAASQNTTRGAR